FRLRLDALPRRAAELVERGLRVAAAADVLLDEVDAVDGQVQAVAGGVLEVEVVALGARDREVLEAAVEPDTVIDVDDVVVGLELGEAREDVRGADLARPPLRAALAEDLLLADEHL